MKKQNIFAIVAAMIWGAAFVAQEICAETLPAFTVNAARSFVAMIFLLLLCLGVTAYKKKKNTYVPMSKKEKKKLIVGGVLCGVFLTLATTLQQTGLTDTDSGKAGFITALYIVIVPILGIFLRKKVPFTVWISVVVAGFGLYFLCVKKNAAIEPSDILLILCAFTFAVQILIIDHYSNIVDGLMLSCVEFITMFVLSFVCMMIFDEINIKGIFDCIVPILYIGVFSSGVAYTLQILAQKGSNPTVITLLLSLEALFGVIAQVIYFQKGMKPLEWLGCALMLVAVVLAQLPVPLFKKRKAE